MNFFAEYAKELVSIIVPFLAWFLNVGLKAKAKLIWTAPHAFSFLVLEPLKDADGTVVAESQSVHTASIRVINVGREVARNVELVFNWKPQYLNRWPLRDFEERYLVDGRYMISFTTLAPKEETGLEILSVNRDLPDIVHVRSSEGVAERVQMLWIRQQPKWLWALGSTLMYFGIAAVIYVLILLLQFLVLST